MKIRLWSVLIVGALYLSACTTDHDNTDFVGILKPDTTNNKNDITKAEGNLRLLSYNVHRCEGMDKVIDYNRIASIINAVKPDFVCLQEIDSMTTRSPQNQVKVLGDKTNMQGYFGGAISYQGGKYGVGLLSKEPALNTYLYNLAPGGAENRVILVAEFKDYLVISVHLDHVVESNRTASVKIITDAVRKFNKKAYIAGDLNEDKLEGPMFIEFKKDWSILSGTGSTFPTNGLTKRIDFILGFSPSNYNYTVTKSAVIYSLNGVSVTTASDHFPVFADFKQ